MAAGPPIRLPRWRCHRSRRTSLPWATLAPCMRGLARAGDDAEIGMLAAERSDNALSCLGLVDGDDGGAGALGAGGLQELRAARITEIDGAVAFAALFHQRHALLDCDIRN